MINIVYSHNKRGVEGLAWDSEIRAASNESYRFIPFNTSAIIDPVSHCDARSLDILYQTRHAPLMALYARFQNLIKSERSDAVIVSNAPPFHPDFLRKLDIYKALYAADDPPASYLINIPYLHAYDHVFFVNPGYSPDMDMSEKMRYAGMRNADWLPISVFDFECDASMSEEICSAPRDLDIVYIGKFWRQKIPILMAVRRAFGGHFHMFGQLRLKHNLYLNMRYAFGNWVSPVSFAERISIYQRAKIGINVHWNDYTLGNQRLYHIPANGAMQICDGADHLSRVFAVDEASSYRSTDELIEKLRYYLDHDDERIAVARRGFRRVMRDYRFKDVTRRAGRLIEEGMKRSSWRKS